MTKGDTDTFPDLCGDRPEPGALGRLAWFLLRLAGRECCGDWSAWVTRRRIEIHMPGGHDPTSEADRERLSEVLQQWVQPEDVVTVTPNAPGYGREVTATWQERSCNVCGRVQRRKLGR